MKKPHPQVNLMNIEEHGSRFGRELENIAPLDNVGRVKNVVDSTQFDRINMNPTNRLKFVATF